MAIALRVKRVLLVAALTGLFASRAWACSTPVYRYALYHWPPEPYRVFYLHRGGPAKQDGPPNKQIAEAMTAAPSPANVIFESIDLDKQPSEQLPEPFRKALDGSLPKHVVFTPWGVEVYSGRLDQGSVAAMIDSPSRSQLAEMLDSGTAAVFVLLTCNDPTENQRAEKTLAEVIARASAGELSGTPESDSAFTAQDEGRQRLTLGLLKVSRADPAEQWLVRSLTAIERDLNEKPLADQPMVFAVYGRGRAMPPYVGKGITTDNLVELVAFLTGACSCQVKEQSPGMDLLIRWDWEATAQRIGSADPGLAPSQPEYMELPVVAAAPMAEKPASEPALASEAGQRDAVQSAVSARPAKPPEPSLAPNKKTEVVRLIPAKQSSTTRAVGRLGIGFAAIAVAVLVTGAVLVFRRGSGQP